MIPVTESATDTSSTATLTWSATGLPTGLSIAPSTGTISGATLHSGVFAVTVTVTDSAGFHGVDQLHLDRRRARHHLGREEQWARRRRQEGHHQGQ